MRGVFIVVFLLINSLYFYFERPVLALGFVDWSNLAIVWGMLLLFVAALMLLNKFRVMVARTPWGEILRQWFPQLFKDRPQVVDISDYQHGGTTFKRYKVMAVIGGLLLALGIGNAVVFPLITSAPLFYNQSYRNLLGEVKESSFTGDIEPINLSQIRIVDEETAKKLADKKIGEVPALGSEIQVGEMELQKVKTSCIMWRHWNIGAFSSGLTITPRAAKALLWTICPGICIFTALSMWGWLISPLRWMMI